MPAITIRQRNTLLPRGDTASHLFIVGQSVRLKPEFMTPASKSSGIYKITRTLPPEGNLLQYRIRNDEEPHERVANQDSLEPVRKPQSESDSVFITGTFDHEQSDKHDDHESEKLDLAKISLSAAIKRKRS
ncbi:MULTISPECIES: hypothetical protein [unclassified Beijerinckia]|uniref:hypothetical protein n=1 Tax=unclassified Beijerinckia TaxID=2638183 RepID=UPI0008984E42|nr:MULTISPECIES: hypothetical protein [unclassified Beijerinckia]MDH7797557.1 hypothetical protein [Beijerinckia sp. GAS462]SEC90369.1 hypothetical protein SAMN05443249_3851 [Beijerinckia sp. 28-YEA-48]